MPLLPSNTACNKETLAAKLPFIFQLPAMSFFFMVNPSNLDPQSL
jgi:hypothetical protein